MMQNENLPKISVVIPSFNQGRYIEDTLLSIIGQQYPNLEIIVIDGGSTDESVEIIQQYSNYLHYWHSRKDRGQSDAINQGFQLSSGDILCWLNSDDAYLPGTLLDVGRRFQGRLDQPQAFYGAAVLTEEDERGHITGSNAHIPPSIKDPFELTYRSFLVQPSTFWTRKLWELTGPLNENYHYLMDWDWFSRAVQQGQFERVPKFYSLYRVHPNHKTGSGSAARHQEVCNLVCENSSKYWSELYTFVFDKLDILQKRTEVLHSFKVLNTLKRSGAESVIKILFPGVFSKAQSVEDFWQVYSSYTCWRPY